MSRGECPGGMCPDTFLWCLISCGENSMHFLQLMPFTIFQIFVPPGTHHWLVDSGCMVWEDFAQHLYTWINLSDLRELVNLPCATTDVGDCETNQTSWYETLWFINVHLEAPLLMHTLVQPLLAVCSVVCGAALYQGCKVWNFSLLNSRRYQTISKHIYI